ncbi:hypothetical protein HK100_001217 [Physocladia obscura]|uniref:Uncharacterized protein n=1 Tax=Physocladia obscura TaxID=109957 RepID=A0AAD5SYW6_9FUNG|nr:hypothetical protein HK100_001217 [Physocladia obscura]
MGRKKNRNTELYLAIYNPYKNISPWSKQISVPHAKQGLQTDIVCEDDHYGQYDPTMKRDFPPHSILTQMSLAKILPAGRPLGSAATKTKVSVVLGDCMKHQPERLCSVAASDYSAFTAEQLSRTTKTREKPDRNPWESKTELVMTSAHVGTATRENIPLDTRHFTNFTSTNMEVYIAPKNVPPLIRFDLKPRGITSIPQGDREKQISYNTESTTSFIPHSTESIKLANGKDFTRPDFHSGTNSALLGKSGENTTFQTTSSSIFAIPPNDSFSDRSISIIKGKHRGRSNIAFGQYFEEPKTAFKNEKEKKNLETVTQRDFVRKSKDIAAPKVSPFARWETNIILDEANTVKTGMPSALRPDTRDMVYVSCARDDFFPSATAISSTNQRLHHELQQPQQQYQVPASESANTAGREMMYRSSIPTGDESKFSNNNKYSTTSASFVAYPDAKMPIFPVRGAKVTLTGFSLGDDTKKEPTGLSTAAASFVNHGRRFKHVEKSHTGFGLAMLKSANDEYSMVDNQTTNGAVYKMPQGHEIAHAFEPKTVQSKLMFPLSKVDTSVQYDTTSQSFFNTRSGILNVKQPHEVGVRNASSIVFGDKRHFNTRGVYTQ